MDRTPRTTSTIAFAIAAALATTTMAVNPFFPGAEGFGAKPAGAVPASGWLSTASVYRVTTTADTINPSTGKPAVGTLRGAFWDYTNPSSPKQMASNRIVVFDVGGVFQLTQGSLDIKTVNNIYVAGQTAPAPVTVYGDSTQITKSNNTMTSNVVMRYMTFRKGTGNGEDAIGFTGGSGTGTIATNMILDHISSSWAEDENFSVANNNTNVTVQYSVIADALTNNHAYGSLIRPQVDSNVTFHHNLYANNASRQARFGTYNAETLTADFRNNVIYNWRDRASYTGGSSEDEQEYTDINYVGNYLVAGPGTIGSPTRAFSVDKNVDTRVYQQGNFVDSDKSFNPGGIPNGADNGWAAFGVSTPVTDQTLTQMPAPFAMASVSTQLAPDAYRQVIDHVGNYWWAREAIDARVINNVLTNTGPANGIGAAAPNAAELASLLATPTIARPAGFDTDSDGMPDAWELQRGLNPNLASDGKLDYDNDQYTNVEEYLNDLGAFPAPHPIAFTGAVNNRFALSANFDANPDPSAVSNWQPSRFDVVTISGATAVVDAIAQDAGTVVLAAENGSSGTLSVDAGSLFVREHLIIGGSAGAAGELYLSGGKLITAGTIGVGTATGGVFGFTGGTLVVAEVDALKMHASVAQSSMGTLYQDGATAVLAPGDVGVSGRTTILGNYRLVSGTLAVDLGGTAQAASFQTTDAAHDAVTVSGNASLDGQLALSTINGYDPAPLVAHTILSAAEVVGHFATVSGHQLSADKWLAVTYDPTGVKVTATLPGDGDVDGDVDFDDLLVLAQGYGTGQTWSAGDFTGNGLADFDDLLTLAQQYGNALSVDGSIITDEQLADRFQSDWIFAKSLVPEPSTLTAGVLAAMLRRKRRIQSQIPCPANVSWRNLAS